MKSTDRSIDEYMDIIDLARPISRNHLPMSMENRAAQFSPFAALTGYESVIDETERLTDRRVELDEQSRSLLDRTLEKLMNKQPSAPEVRVRFFIPDRRKSGGSYEEYRGCVRKIDPYERRILFTDGTAISMEQILELEECACGNHGTSV